MATPFARSIPPSTAARLYGRCGACQTLRRYRCSPPRTPANLRANRTNLPAMTLGEHVASDYQTLRLSLKAHPMALLRDRLAGVATCADLAALRDGAWTKVAGLVLVRQRPGQGTAIFVTLEDETGIANLVLWARTFERFRRETMSARLMLAHGCVQKSPEGVLHLMTQRIVDRSDLLNRLWRDDAPSAQPSRARHPRNVRTLPKSRDFHCSSGCPAARSLWC